MEHEDRRYVDRYTLYEEIWTEPVSVVATRYGLSDVGLAKICRSLAIPLPSRGYWSKVRAGKIMKKAALPELPRGERPVKLPARLPPAEARMHAEARVEAAKIRKQVVICDVRTSISPHPLVLATSSRLSQQRSFPTDTGLCHSPADVLDIAVTPAALDRALLIANTLLKELENHGVMAYVNSHKSATILTDIKTGVEIRFILSEHVRRTVHEITPIEERARKRHFDRIKKGLLDDYPNIPRYDYQPTGMLAIAVGNSPSRVWRDTPKPHSKNEWATSSLAFSFWQGKPMQSKWKPLVRQRSVG